MQTWNDLVHSFEGPSDTKENRVMDLKLEYNTFRAKDSESLSETYTRYKTLLNELSNDGVVLSKHEINVGFVNSLPEKWLNFSQGLRNANHIQNLELPQIYGKFVYEDNLISRRYPDSKKAQETKKPLTLTSPPISTAFIPMVLCRIFKRILMMKLMRGVVRSTSGIYKLNFKRGNSLLTPEGL